MKTHQFTLLSPGAWNDAAHWMKSYEQQCWLVCIGFTIPGFSSMHRCTVDDYGTLVSVSHF